MLLNWSPQYISEPALKLQYHFSFYFISFLKPAQTTCVPLQSLLRACPNPSLPCNTRSRSARLNLLLGICSQKLADRPRSKACFKRWQQRQPTDRVGAVAIRSKLLPSPTALQMVWMAQQTLPCRPQAPPADQSPGVLKQATPSRTILLRIERRTSTHHAALVVQASLEVPEALLPKLEGGLR